MTTRYEIRISGPGGQSLTSPLPILRDRGAWQYTRADKMLGTLTLALPIDAYPRSWMRADSILTIWRSIDGGPYVLAEDTGWLLDGLRFDDASTSLVLSASDGLTLIDRRVVDYAEDSAQATKTAVAADNMIKAFVRENASSLATDTARRMDSAYFAVAPDLALGPLATKAAARARLLQTVQEVADDATRLGTFTTFDVTYADGLFTFQTFIRTRGVDRRNSKNIPLIGPAYGNIRNAALNISYRSEVNAAYATGQGEAALELVGSAVDTTQATVSPGARRERVVSARNAKTQAQVNAEASAALRAGRVLAMFSGDFVDTPNVRYGRDIAYGDIVPVQAFGYVFDCRVSAITVGQTAAGADILQLGLRSEANVSIG